MSGRRVIVVIHPAHGVIGAALQEPTLLVKKGTDDDGLYQVYTLDIVVLFVPDRLTLH